MSRLRRLMLSDRYFFVTCNLPRTREPLDGDDFEILTRVIEARRAQHGFFLTAWVFLPDHWHAIVGVRYPQTISLILESIKVGSTRQMNTRHREAGRLREGRFTDRALRTVKEYQETVEYIHWNPVRRGLVARPEEWPWSSVREYGFEKMADARHPPALRIDRVRIPTDEKEKKSRRVREQLCATCSCAVEIQIYNVSWPAARVRGLQVGDSPCAVVEESLPKQSRG